MAVEKELSLRKQHAVIKEGYMIVQSQSLWRKWCWEAKYMILTKYFLQCGLVHDTTGAGGAVQQTDIMCLRLDLLSNVFFSFSLLHDLSLI